jgi:cardiolipin synthase
VAEPPLNAPQGTAGGPARGSKDQAGGRAATRWQPPRLTFRRLSGLDRSGPAPPQTQAGQPLRPWTIPNAIGFFRLALIPVFLVAAFSTDDGTGALPATLFAVIGWGDYADGIAARVTRQYSRLGALMDPVTDRLLVICGVVVTWHFQLLPRWALALLAGRELLMLVLGRLAQTHDIELSINWPGRLAVAPVMGAFFFAMLDLGVLAEVLLYVGLGLALLATAMYVRSGVAELRRRRAEPDESAGVPPAAGGDADVH